MNGLYVGLRSRVSPCVRSNFDTPYVSHINAAHKENICLISDAAGAYQEYLIHRLDTWTVSVAYMYAAHVSRVRCITPYLKHSFPFNSVRMLYILLPCRMHSVFLRALRCRGVACAHEY